MTDAVRTPDDAFADLADFALEPRYREWEGLRLAHVEAGEPGQTPVVLVHGEPTWSYLWRKVIGPVHEAGFRCVAPDLPGFGRSDKPTDQRWYTYDRHTEAVASLADELDLRGATMVVHDWGGPIGMRVFAEAPDRFERLVILDTGLFTGEQRMTDAWRAFRDFVERTPDLPISRLVRGGCHTDPGDEVAAAYDAPFPDAASKAGARAFPLMIPLSPEDPGAEAGRRVRTALQGDERAKLLLWADSDPVIPLAAGRRLSEVLGAPQPEVVAEAGHFLQEDAGERIGRRIAAWLQG